MLVTVIIFKYCVQLLPIHSLIEYQRVLYLRDHLYPPPLLPILLGFQQTGRLVDRINTQTQAIIQQLWDYPCEERATNFETGICVNFDQIDFKVAIDHKVVPKYLKTVLIPTRVHLVIDGPEAVSYQSLHAREEIPHKRDRLFLMISVKVPLKVIYAQLIGIFKFAVVFVIHLHSVIGQVNIPIKVRHIKRLRACAQVAISIEVAFEETVC